MINQLNPSGYRLDCPRVKYSYGLQSVREGRVARDVKHDF